MASTSQKSILASDILDQASLHANMMRVLFGAIKDRDDRGGPETKKDIDYLVSLGQFATTQFEAVYTSVYVEALDTERDQENRLDSLTNHIQLVDQKCASTSYHVSAKELENYMAYLVKLAGDEGHE